MQVDLCDKNSGRLRKDWKILMQEAFEKSEFKPLLKTKVGNWKVRQFEPRPSGIIYLIAICDTCQMKSVLRAAGILLEKQTRCHHCNAWKKVSKDEQTEIN